MEHVSISPGANWTLISVLGLFAFGFAIQQIRLSVTAIQSKKQRKFSDETQTAGSAAILEGLLKTFREYLNISETVQKSSYKLDTLAASVTAINTKLEKIDCQHQENREELIRHESRIRVLEEK